MRLLLIISFICFYAIHNQAQKIQCLQDRIYISEQPDSPIIQREKVHLPVVVHILYNNSIENITDEQILSQIEVLNEDFSLNNVEFENTPEVFKNVAADTEIQFCLATQDPDGNPTSGITRTFTNIDDIGLTESYYLTNLGGVDAWDNSKYINIWVASMGTSSVSGIGTFPGQALPPEKDGILMNFKFFGREGLAEDFFPHHLGRICVHEMGHYFGLPHIFGSIGTACDDDDGFNDTPLQDDPSFACPEFPAPDICTQNNGVMFMNFMDYTDDQCMSMFTQDQKTRMWETLNGFRSGLMNQTQDLCIVKTSSAPTIKQWKIFPNPSKDYTTLEDEQFSNIKLELIDIQGKILIEKQIIEQQTIIELSNFESGIYFIRYKNKLQKLIIL